MGLSSVYRGFISSGFKGFYGVFIVFYEVLYVIGFMLWLSWVLGFVSGTGVYKAYWVYWALAFVLGLRFIPCHRTAEVWRSPGPPGASECSELWVETSGLPGETLNPSPKP